MFASESLLQLFAPAIPVVTVSSFEIQASPNCSSAHVDQAADQMNCRLIGEMLCRICTCVCVWGMC